MSPQLQQEPEPESESEEDEDETPSTFKSTPSKPKPTVENESFMDLDIDLDSSWPFDQNFFLPNPPESEPEPLLGSTTFPPIWGFSDADELLSCYPNSAAENIVGNGDKKGLCPPSVELMEDADDSCVIKERMTQALRHFKESTEQHVLVQVWAPIKKGNRCLLTTSGQPFVLDPHSNGLLQYRTVSLMYKFSADGESDGDLGLPGRVFRQRLPEWTPNVQYYSSKEYPRLNHALHYNVRGTLALPVFESVGQSCVGVVELIMTSQKINYASEVDKVCRALEAVNLKSSEILDNPNMQICNGGRQKALVEILEILTVVCETHKLPLAQTWVPCRHRSVLAYGGGSKKSCSSFDGSCMGQVCMSTTDVACYVLDAHMWGFRDACAEHHLQKGQGLAGRAFSSYRSCFSTDIRRFSKNEYPLVHYARMFGLMSSFAICLRSFHTGSDDYVLEFFLPPSIKDITGQLALLRSLFATMKKYFGSLKVASGKELEEEEKCVEIIENAFDEIHDSKTACAQMAARTTLEQSLVAEEIDDLRTDANLASIHESHVTVPLTNDKGASKTMERRRGKAEKSISLEVLQQYFTGSLKDAAKSLGVCPTTMKRICRQHGISRWPSRKINKVNRSLTKLKRVIESVEGNQGAYSLTSLAATPLPIATGSNIFSGYKPSAFKGQREESIPQKKLQTADTENQVLEAEFFAAHQQLTGERSKSDTKFCQILDGSNARCVSADESTDTHTSQGSGQSSPTNETTPSNDQVGSDQERDVNMIGMLLEESGSSKDLKNLCTPEQVPQQDSAPTLTMPHISATQDTRSVTIKATYREDIVRFRFSSTSCLVELKEQVSKRLKLEVDIFYVKYLDDDDEWVSLSTDADLQECMDISRFSGKPIIRLQIHDTITSLGSSRESSGE
ncbi:hypothetical protein GIB67_033395 [Kingdonia uniflora]|uniref:Uncharacterized protein n=1 Tax=Kingdonia uniflora TaxID=39325 RepID=A0A7J7LTN2_9MAGN|nr:hypothetical protein GIB67_033395 [Kingdonia uniflora]